MRNPLHPNHEIGAYLARQTIAAKMWLLLIQVVFIFLITNPLGLLAENGMGLVLEGVYTCDYSIAFPGVEASGRGVFQVSIQGAAWVVRYKSSSAQTNVQALYSETIGSSDGTNTYVVHALNPLAIKQASDTNEVVMTEAKIYPGVCPPPMEHNLYNLWVAFISSTVWIEPSGKTKPPNTPDLSLFYNPDFYCDYIWTTNQQEQGTRQLTLKTGSRLLQRDFHDNGKPRYLSLPSPYQDGYTIATGSWSETTNLAGVLAPTQFTFSYFSPKDKPVSAADLLKIFSAQCSVTNIYNAECQHVPAGLQGGRNVLVWDHRFAEQGHPTITYELPNDWTPSIDVQLLKRMVAMPKVSLEDESLHELGFKSRQSTAISKTALIRTVVVALMLLSLIIMALNSLRKRQKQSHGTR